MSSRFNAFMDSMSWRIAVNLVGFGAWLLAAVVLLRAASWGA